MSAGRYDLMVEAFFTDQGHLLEFVTGKLGCLPGSPAWRRRSS